MERRGYPLAVLHEYRMTREDVAATVEHIAQHSIEELRGETGIGEARMALVPIAAEVLGQLVKTFKPRDIAVSSYGIREGMLFEQMPQHIRDRDPLIEACRFYEAKDARIPGFGKWLYKFIAPLFPGAPYEELRLIRAACLLHDVSWRAHPDYRHEVTFEAATRSNLGGMTHEERVFLGLALLHRYKNSRAENRFEPLIPLLDEDAIRRAEILGKALRFGAMLSVQAKDLMGRLDWDPEARHLTMHLADGSEHIFGEVVEARFNSLASALEATTEVVRPD